MTTAPWSGPRGLRGRSLPGTDALRPADVDETPKRGELPRACANRLARAKADAALKSVQLDDELRGAIDRAYARIEHDTLHLTTEMLSPDGSARWRRVGDLTAPAPRGARDLGLRLGAEVHAAAGDQRVDPATLDG